MFLQAVILVVMAFGGFFWYPRLIGTILNFFCACTCHLACVVVLFSARLSPMGELCSWNLTESTYKGKDDGWEEPTYQDDANKLLGLAATQFIFWIVQCFCCCIPLFCTPVEDKEYD